MQRHDATIAIGGSNRKCPRWFAAIVSSKPSSVTSRLRRITPAFKTKTSTFNFDSSNNSAHLRTDFRDAKSTGKKCCSPLTPGSFAMDSIAAFARWASRQAKITVAPASAKALQAS